MTRTSTAGVAPAPASRAAAGALDALDPLRGFRDRFEIPPDLVYLDGNSLGALPRGLPERLREVVAEEWGSGLIRSWTGAGWMEAPRRVGDKLARLLGAAPGEVLAGDSTSVNLFKLLALALALRPGRRVVLTQRDNFPTDLYIAEGLCELAGARLRIVDAGELLGALDGEVAVMSLTHVHYATGLIHDLPGLTRAAHEAGALALWDLSHTAGAMPVDLDGAGADLAVGCGYKHLCGGPGAPAWSFIAAAHHDRARQPLTGWLGHAQPFAFEPAYRAAAGVGQAMVGTPSILSLAALEYAVDLWLEVDLGAVRAKTVALGNLLVGLLASRCAGLGLSVASPLDGAVRGAHVGVRHAQGYAVMQALIAGGVVGDFRTPDLMRFGLHGLTTRFVDVWDAVEALRRVLLEETWRRPEYQVRAAVT